MEDKNTFNKIRKVLHFVWTSPYSSFYRDKYKKEGIDLLKDINSMEDFKKLPYLTKEEILNTDPFDRFFSSPKKPKWVHISGGTTGGRVLAILRSGVVLPAAKFQIQKALELKIKTAIIILTETAYWAVLTRPAFRHKSILRCLGSVYDLERTATIIRDLKIEAIDASPNTLELIIPYLKKEGVIDNIRYLVIAGENISEARYKHIKSVFKNAYLTFEYGLAEANLIGYTCSNLAYGPNRNIYHPISSHYYLEQVNLDKKDELCVTHLFTKTDLPMIRYRTGDVVKVYKEECLCGAKYKMKSFGRWGTYVLNIRGYYFYVEELEKAISPFYKYLKVLNWKLQIYDYSKKKNLPKLKLQLIPKENTPASVKSLITKTVSGSFNLSEDKTLESLVKKKVFLPLEVEFVSSFDSVTKHKNFVYHLDD